MDDVRKTITFPDNEVAEIELAAEKHDRSFSAEVRKRCRDGAPNKSKQKQAT